MSAEKRSKIIARMFLITMLAFLVYQIWDYRTTKRLMVEQNRKQMFQDISQISFDTSLLYKVNAADTTAEASNSWLDTSLISNIKMIVDSLNKIRGVDGLGFYQIGEIVVVYRGGRPDSLEIVRGKAYSKLMNVDTLYYKR